MQKSRLMILDANALLHRAWHALPPLTNPEGKIVNAIYGVLMVVLKLLDEKKPDAFVACWDTKAPTFRHEAYDAYKAGREKQGDELYEQIPPLQEALSLLGVESIFKDGFEADDLIATIALQNKKSWDVMIVTGDRDTLQLVQPGISVLAFKKGVTDTILYDDAEVERQYGLKPIQFVDYKALRGDPSDNIPGVRGIGEKGATELLKTYGTMEGILKAAHDLKSALSPSIRQKMLDGEPTLEAGLALVRLIADVPIAYKPKERGEQAIDREGFMKFLQQMGFKTLLARFSGQAVKKENKEIQKQPKKQETVSAIEVKDEKGFEKMMGALRDSKEIVIETARAAQDSLFAGAAFGLVLGTGEEIWHIQETQIKKGKKELQTLFNREMPFVAHDAKSQQYGLDQMGLCAPVWSFDTMLAAYLLAAGERNHDLPSVAARYAELTVSEDAPATDRVAAILRLVEPLRAALKEEKVISVLERFELPLIDVLYQMEREGILIDRPYLATLSKEMTKEKEKIEKKMFTLAKREFNPASPSQLAVVLFEDLKLPTKGIKKGKQGYSTAAPELEKLRASHPIINLVDEHRELSKLLSTYVDVLPTLADKSGRVHTTFNQAVTSTGRLSSSDPNLQNIPIRTDVGRQIRRAFIADTGKVLISCDYSQIELRLVAALAKDERMLTAFRNHADIHTATAAAIWLVPEKDVTPDMRRAAKAINFGLIYGQGPMGLSVSAGISFEEAKQFIATYFEVYSGVKKYLDGTRTSAAELGYVETLFGRKRPLPEIHSSMHQVRAAAERMAINMPVQGTAADMMKLAMIKVQEKLSGVCKDARLLLQVHDELVVEAPEKDAHTVAKFVKETMENIEKLDVPIVVEAKIGKNWGEMKTV